MDQSPLPESAQEQNAREQIEDRRKHNVALRIVGFGCLGFLLLFASCVICIAVASNSDSPSTTSSPSTREPQPASPANRCKPAPLAIVRKIESGLTAEGGASLSRVRLVDNNDGRPWKFIGAEIVAPGMNGTRAVWATGSLDLNETAFIVTADTMAATFSIWNKPAGGAGFAAQFDDEISVAQQCP